MKKYVLGMACGILNCCLLAQNISQKVQNAFIQFEKDSQLKHAISSIYIVDAKTGELVFEKNSRVGLAPASTQKIITASTALELLGKDYRYKTKLAYTGNVKNNTLSGNLIVRGSGDPTLGSSRFYSAKRQNILKGWVNAVKLAGIKKINGQIAVAANRWSEQSLPDGWIWQDIGNYYGAGATLINWNENQYDLILKSGQKPGDKTEIIKTIPDLPGISFYNEVISGPRQSGDNAFIHLAPYSGYGIITGTIPAGNDSFSISGSLPSPGLQAIVDFKKDLEKETITVTGERNSRGDGHDLTDSGTINTVYSPSLDSIIYWFLKKSINLYGEALLKTIAYEKKGMGDTDTGLNMVKDFWKQKGLDPGELNLYDGSGLSPLNRITTHAQVEVLKYASRQSWFRYFYDAIPEYNGMRLKSGTISDVKGFCGYHKSKAGREYIVSFLVNNYNGPSSTLVNKMYRVLDILK